jgi:hypothetical protein
VEIKEFPKDTKPREIFNYVCERIAEPLKELGFKHRKKEKDIYKLDANFTYRIWFQPAYRGSTRFIVHISIESEKMALWREVKYAYADGVVFTTRLDNLTKRAQVGNWHDVTTLSERERVISEILKQINEYAIPYFEKFKNVDLLISEIEEQGFLPHRINDKQRKWDIYKKAEYDFAQCYLFGEIQHE